MQVLEKAAPSQPPAGQTPSDPSLAGKVGTLKLLSSKAVWAIIVVNFVNHWGYFIYLNWMPSYFVKALGVDLRASSILSFLPWTVMAVGSTSAGLPSVTTTKNNQNNMKEKEPRKPKPNLVNSCIFLSLFLCFASSWGSLAYTSSPVVDMTRFACALMRLVYLC